MCRFCGGNATSPPEMQSAEEARRQLGEARSAILDKPSGLDFRRAASVVERGFQALDEGDLEEASRAVQALLGALGRLEGTASALARIQAAKEGVNGEPNPRQDEPTTKAAAASRSRGPKGGDSKGTKVPPEAAKKQGGAKSSPRQVETRLAAARKKIHYARERGGSTAKAQEALAGAEEALERGDVPEAETLGERAHRMAEYARKNAYAQSLIDGAKKHIAKAADRGAEPQEAEGTLQRARKALKSGVYADVQKWTKATREAAERARRRKVAEDNIHRVEKLLEQEAKEGSDLTETKPHMEEAWRALQEDRFSAVTKALARCRREAEGAARIRKAKESLNLLRVELEEVRAMRGDTSSAEEARKEAKEALAKRDWRAFRGKFQKANRAATRARKEREREIVLTTVEQVVERAGEGGVSALGARELLVEVEKALAQGRASDIESLVEAKFEAEAARQESEVLRGIADLRSLLAEVKVAGLEISGAVGFLDQAQDALESQEVSRAEELLQRAREASTSLEEALQASARRSVEELETEASRMREAGTPVPEAEEFLARAKKGLEKGRASEGLDLARMGLEACREARPEAPAAEASPERRITLERRLSKLRALIKDLDRAEISIEGSDEDLEEAEHALTRGQLDEAKDALTSLEEVADLLSDGLEVAAQDRLAQAGVNVQAAATEGLTVDRGNQVLSSAQEALKEGRYVQVLEYCKVIEDIVTGARQKAIVGDVTTYLGAVRADLAALKGQGITLPRMEAYYEAVRETASRGEIERARLMARGLGEALEDLKAAISQGDAAEEAEDVAARIEEARDVLVKAHEALKQGDPEAVRPLLTTAILRLGEGSQGLEAFIGEVQQQLTVAEALGAGVDAARQALAEAEASGETPTEALASLEEARRLVRESVRSLGEEAQPDLVVEMPEEGLVEGQWTHHRLYVENRGKAPARQVRLRLHGDVDVKGLEPIAEVTPGERQEVEMDLRPRAGGRLELEAEIAFHRFFDDKEVQKTQPVRIRSSSPGTYLVEDAFLVHVDGRLICHESRRTLDAIDEDIFGGMLTVVQDFVKDSFRQRTKTGLRRLEFAESKIIIERGPRVFLAAVLLGEEPELLPLYMAEVISEIEREYGDHLEDWTGLLSEVEGVEERVRKLLYFTDEEVIRGPEGTEMTLASALRLIRGGKALGLDLAESEELLTAAKEAVVKDTGRAWDLIQDAVEKALKSQQEMQRRLEAGVDLLENELEELAQAGLEGMEGMAGEVDTRRTQVEEAKRALARGEFDAAARLVGSVEESLTVLKDRVVGEHIEAALDRIDVLLAGLEGEGADVSVAREELEEARTAMGEGKLGRVHGHLEEAEALTRKLRRTFMLEKRRRQLEAVEEIIATSELQEGEEDLNRVLKAAHEAAEARDVDELEACLKRATAAVLAPARPDAEGKDARLLVRTPSSPLQAGVWNRYVVEITNRGDWPAENVVALLNGDVDVKGDTTLERLDPGQTQALEMAVRPRGGADGTVEVEVTYRRLLDEGQVMRDVRDLPVVAPNSYPVTDALLYLPTGAPILHVTRLFRSGEEQEALDAGLSPVTAFVREETGRPKPFARIETPGGKAVILQGGITYLVALCPSEEPTLLPLYMVEMLREVEDRYGAALKEWRGNARVQAGLRKILQRLLLATDVEGANLGPLTTSPVTARLLYGTPPARRAEYAQEVLRSVSGAVEKDGFAGGLVTLEEALGRELTPRPPPSPKRPGVEGISVEVDDITLKEFIDIVKEIDRAVSKARGKAGLEILWPVPRIAIRAAKPEVAAAASSFMAMILSHANAKSVDILQKGEFWKGADLKMQVDEAALTRTYDTWAKRIGLILRSRDPWKVKEGIDKGGYEMGIEGQSITIAPGTVSFQLIIPDHVVVQQFPGGMVFLDTTLTEETEAEGYANEIIRIVLEARKEMGLDDAQPVLLKLIASLHLRGLLARQKEYLQQEAHVRDVTFVEDPGDAEYVVEAEIRDETFTVVVEVA